MKEEPYSVNNYLIHDSLFISPLPYEKSPFLSFPHN